MAFMDSDSEIFRIEVPAMSYKDEDITGYGLLNGENIELNSLELSLSKIPEVKYFLSALLMFEVEKEEMMQKQRTWRFVVHDDGKGISWTKQNTALPDMHCRQTLRPHQVVVVYLGECYPQMELDILAYAKTGTQKKHIDAYEIDHKHQSSKSF
eukprot:GHVP01034541.1.p1 GENE.GHVP01034541.1~~GHVP01034541.1.p1  ORF type:complete len:154 (+),score=25.53 GHVP01034541.1:246-707(+)